MQYNAVKCGAYKTTTKSVFQVQKRVIRIICKVSKYHHSIDLSYALNVMKFYDLIDYKVAIIMFKVVNHLLPKSFEKPSKQTDSSESHLISSITFRFVFLPMLLYVY